MTNKDNIKNSVAATLAGAVIGAGIGAGGVLLAKDEKKRESFFKIFSDVKKKAYSHFDKAEHAAQSTKKELEETLHKEDVKDVAEKAMK